MCVELDIKLLMQIAKWNYYYNFIIIIFLPYGVKTSMAENRQE